MSKLYVPELRFLQAELKRVTDLIQFSDRKSMFLATIYTAIWGIIISQKSVLLNNISAFQGVRIILYWIIMILIVLCSMYGMYFLMKAIFPSTKAINGSLQNKSLTYSDLIAYREFPTEEALLNHLTLQIHTISVVAVKKMESIQKSDKNLFTLISLTLILFLLFK